MRCRPKQKGLSCNSYIGRRCSIGSVVKREQGFSLFEELESGKGMNISYVRGGETGKRSNVIRQAIVTAGEGGRGGGNP